MSRSLSEAMDEMSDAEPLATPAPGEAAPFSLLSLPRPLPFPSKAVNEPPESADPPKKPDPTRLGKYGVCAPLDRPFAAAAPGPELDDNEPCPPGVRGVAPTGGWRASREACRRRLVVPSALVCEERAEQTRATRELGM